MEINKQAYEAARQEYRAGLADRQGEMSAWGRTKSNITNLYRQLVSNTYVVARAVEKGKIAPLQFDDNDMVIDFPAVQSDPSEQKAGFHALASHLKGSSGLTLSATTNLGFGVALEKSKSGNFYMKGSFKIGEDQVDFTLAHASQASTAVGTYRYDELTGKMQHVAGSESRESLPATAEDAAYNFMAKMAFIGEALTTASQTGDWDTYEDIASHKLIIHRDGNNMMYVQSLAPSQGGEAAMAFDLARDTFLGGECTFQAHADHIVKNFSSEPFDKEATYDINVALPKKEAAVNEAPSKDDGIDAGGLLGDSGHSKEAAVNEAPSKDDGIDAGGLLGDSGHSFEIELDMDADMDLTEEVVFRQPGQKDYEKFNGMVGIEPANDKRMSFSGIDSDAVHGMNEKRNSLVLESALEVSGELREMLTAREEEITSAKIAELEAQKHALQGAMAAEKKKMDGIESKLAGFKVELENMEAGLAANAEALENLQVSSHEATDMKALNEVHQERLKAQEARAASQVKIDEQIAELKASEEKRDLVANEFFREVHGQIDTLSAQITKLNQAISKAGPGEAKEKLKNCARLARALRTEMKVSLDDTKDLRARRKKGSLEESNAPKRLADSCDAFNAMMEASRLLMISPKPGLSYSDAAMVGVKSGAGRDATAVKQKVRAPAQQLAARKAKELALQEGISLGPVEPVAVPQPKKQVKGFKMPQKENARLVAQAQERLVVLSQPGMYKPRGAALEKSNSTTAVKSSKKKKKKAASSLKPEVAPSVKREVPVQSQEPTGVMASLWSFIDDMMGAGERV